VPPPTDCTTSSDKDRRGWARQPLEEATSITLSSGERRYNCRIENLSLAGMKLNLAGGLPPDGPVTLEHASVGSFQAQAIWHDRDVVGVRFCDPETDLERALRCVNLIINPDAPPPAG